MLGECSRVCEAGGFDRLSVGPFVGRVLYKGVFPVRASLRSFPVRLHPQLHLQEVWIGLAARRQCRIKRVFLVGRCLLQAKA